MKQKKRYTSESVRVDKDIACQVREHLIGKESIGGFYDRAASEKLERERNTEKVQYNEQSKKI
jgi:hypothetical protein